MSSQVKPTIIQLSVKSNKHFLLRFQSCGDNKQQNSRILELHCQYQSLQTSLSLNCMYNHEIRLRYLSLQEYEVVTNNTNQNMTSVHGVDTSSLSSKRAIIIIGRHLSSVGITWFSALRFKTVSCFLY